MKRSVFLFVYSLAASGAALGTQQSHVHGELEMQMVQEGTRLSIRLQSPLANIVGFEYQPVDAEDKWKLNQAVSTFSSTDWLSMEGQVCKTESVDVSYSWQKQTDHEEHKHHDHDEHEQHNTHASMFVDYELLCEQEKMVPAVVDLFKHFPAIERIDAQWINDSGQGATVLTPSQNLIRP